MYIGNIVTGVIAWQQDGRNVFTGTYNDLSFTIIIHELSTSLILPDELGGAELTLKDEAAALEVAEKYATEDRGLRIVREQE